MGIHLKNTILATLLLTLFSFSVIWAAESHHGSDSQYGNEPTMEEVDNSQFQPRASYSAEDLMPASLISSLHRLEAQSP